MSPDLLLLHYTGMDDHDRARAWLCNPISKVSCHYLVDVDGTITQMVAERARAWHAGKGGWLDETDINTCSVGIEVHNAGHDGGAPPYPATQMAAVRALSKDIVERWQISPARVLGHADIAPQRKPDPGEYFDWAGLAQAGIGLFPGERTAISPALIRSLGAAGADEHAAAHGIAADLRCAVSCGTVTKGEHGPHVRAARRLFAKLGFQLEPDGPADDAFANVILAFQRHWRQSKADGTLDVGTLATLAALLSSPH